MQGLAPCQRHETLTGRVLWAEEIRVVAAAGNASLCWGVVDARMGLANRVVGLQPCSPRSHSQKWLLRRVGANLQIHPALFSHECLELATQREADPPCRLKHCAHAGGADMGLRRDCSVAALPGNVILSPASVCSSLGFAPDQGHVRFCGFMKSMHSCSHLSFAMNVMGMHESVLGACTQQLKAPAQPLPSWGPLWSPPPSAPSPDVLHKCPCSSSVCC